MRVMWRKDIIYFNTANRTRNGENAEDDNSEEWKGG